MKLSLLAVLIFSANAFASMWGADLMTNSGLTEVLYSVENRMPGVLKKFGNMEGGQISGVLRQASQLGLQLGGAGEGFDVFAPTPLLSLSWPSRLWVQEMPKPASYFREGLASADKINGTALYSVLKRVKVFTFGKTGAFAKKNLNGYLVLVEVSIEGEIVPYILSIHLVKPKPALTSEDEMHHQDVILIQRMIANQYVSRKYLLPEEQSVEGESVNVALPKNWQVVDQFVGENPYSGDKLKKAKLIPLNLGALALAQNTTRQEDYGAYYPIPFESLSPLALGELYQAIDLHVIPRRQGLPLYAVLRKSREELLNTLGLTELQAKAAMMVNRGASAEIQPSELRRPKAFLLEAPDFVLISQALGMKGIEVLRHWPLLNAVAQIMALPEASREVIFQGEDLNGFLTELREKLASRAMPGDGTPLSWEHAVLDRHYFLQLPQVEECRAALHPPKKLVL